MFKDLSFSVILYCIGDHKIKMALLNLGSIDNLIPYSIELELGFGELKPSNCTLHLADRSARTPRGCIDDVLVQFINDSFLLILLYWT